MFFHQKESCASPPPPGKMVANAVGGGGKLSHCLGNPSVNPQKARGAASCPELRASTGSRAAAPVRVGPRDLRSFHDFSIPTFYSYLRPTTPNTRSLRVTIRDWLLIWYPKMQPISHVLKFLKLWNKSPSLPPPSGYVSSHTSFCPHRTRDGWLTKNALRATVRLVDKK